MRDPRGGWRQTHARGGVDRGRGGGLSGQGGFQREPLHRREGKICGRHQAARKIRHRDEPQTRARHPPHGGVVCEKLRGRERPAEIHRRMSAPQIHPGEICLIMATRGRPQMLAEVFTALKAHSVQKEKVSLWLYVDEDDAVTRKAIADGSLSDAGVQLHWHIGQQTSGLGLMQQILWQVSGRTAEVFMVLGDDVRFDTPGWDNILRETAAKFPDGIFLASPHDPMTADTCTYPVFGWRWLETLQSLFCGHFPFWYDDRWVHQIGEMAGRYAWLPIVVQP